MLNQVNAVYIPGDNENVLRNEKFMSSVAFILQYASDFNHKNAD